LVNVASKKKNKFLRDDECIQLINHAVLQGIQHTVDCVAATPYITQSPTQFKKMNQEQCYFSLDLELNNAQDNSTDNPKIIQVGIAVGSYLNYKNNAIVKYKWYLNPQEHIFAFITSLTGITNEDINKHALPHEQVASEICQLITTHQRFINPVTWGGGDSIELKLEFANRGIHFPHFGRRWIDVKTWYTLHMLAMGRKPSGGLSSALASFKLHFEGAPHRADDDAFNTLRLFFATLERQDQYYQLISDAKKIHQTYK